MQNDCLWVADCQRLQFTPNQLAAIQLGTGGRESVGRQSNLSSFRSKFIFWLCIQNAKTVVVGEDWSVGKSSYCYPRTAANLRATWAKSSIPNCFCFATTPPPPPLLLLEVWSGWHDQKHRRDMAYDCEWVVCLLGSSLNRRIICLSLHKAALSDFIVVVPFHRPERGFVGVETRSACKTGWIVLR